MFFQERIELEKEVDYRNLENVIKECADKFNWKVDVAEKYRSFYQLGKLKEREYDHTSVTLKNGSIFPEMKLSIYSKDKGNLDHFFVSWNFGSSNEERENYLNLVSEKLKNYNSSLRLKEKKHKSLKSIFVNPK